MKLAKASIQIYGLIIAGVAIAAYFFIGTDPLDSSVPAEGLPQPVAEQIENEAPAIVQEPTLPEPPPVVEVATAPEPAPEPQPILIDPLAGEQDAASMEEPTFPKGPTNPWLNPEFKDLVYAFPTDNKALLEDDNETFFMYVDRFFEKETTRPWQAGRFGFVRNPFRISTGEVWFSKLHEGIDIAPIERDERDEPLDLIRPVAPGTVVHTSAVSGRSNYGRYIVVAHDLPEGTFYSLYAHLMDVRTEVGAKVDNSTVIARMGYSGVGLNKRRAHLHLELAFMINSDYTKFGPKANYHGNYNGLNLIGMNMEDILRAGKGEKTVSISDYLLTQEELYRIRIPNKPELDIIKRYPFLLRATEAERATAASLDIAFTAQGIPLAAYPCEEAVRAPKVLSSKPLPTLLQNCTSNRLKNNSQNPQLTGNGLRFMQIFTSRAK
ncbi:MAG: M23 family metallopeptidase [Akkermansia sp.]